VEIVIESETLFESTIGVILDALNDSDVIAESRMDTFADKLDEMEESLFESETAVVDIPLDNEFISDTRRSALLIIVELVTTIREFRSRPADMALSILARVFNVSGAPPTKDMIAAFTASVRAIPCELINCEIVASWAERAISMLLNEPDSDAMPETRFDTFVENAIDNETSVDVSDCTVLDTVPDKDAILESRLDIYCELAIDRAESALFSDNSAALSELVTDVTSAMRVDTLTENPEESVLTLFSRDTTALDNPVDSDATSEMRVNVCIENAVDCTWSLVTRKYV
jgi:hypothetical protein